MSAIWGIIGRNSKNQIHRFGRMTDSMKRYRIDRFSEVESDNCFMGCGHQYFTEEAYSDVSPIYDEEKKVIFAADCFIYNRDDILCRIDKGDREQDKIGDAELAYLLYKKEGLTFVSLLRGAFAIAIYDKEAKELHLFTDHFCKRYLAYHVDDEYISFASCYKPILAAGNDEFKLSERSIVNAFSTMSPLNFREYEITPFEGIFHLDASMHYAVNTVSGSIKKEQYWTPIKSVKKLKGLTDEKYREIFLDIYQKVCTAHLRSRKETGIMLSGGLDSSSVLAMVAPVLKSRGKKIYSYTTIPCKDYKPRINASVVEDETYLVKEQQKIHDNLEPRFLDSDNENCIERLPEFQKKYDIPVKAAINSNSVYKMGAAAVEDGCLILLSGSNGNATVSYGYITNYVGLCLQKLNIVRAIREVDKYCGICGISRKRMLKGFIRDIWDYIFETRNVGQFYISKENRKKYHIKRQLADEKKRHGSTFVSTEQQKRNFMYIPMQYIQKSLYYTINSLEQGYLQLDPTLSVEMVELCMSLPNECFVKNGIERRLVREYMKDLIPPAITDMRKGYGVQASDFYFRINRDWDKLKDEVYSILQEPSIYKYLDKKEVEELIEDIKKSEHNLSWNTAWFMTNICSLGYFLKEHEKYI